MVYFSDVYLLVVVFVVWSCKNKRASPAKRMHESWLPKTEINTRTIHVYTSNIAVSHLCETANSLQRKINVKNYAEKLFFLVNLYSLRSNKYYFYYLTLPHSICEKFSNVEMLSIVKHRDTIVIT